uniref:Uncharacterized protein n=1 Tax=Panagrolaimus sp. JU765 TaxID=591449 RepID=A0AC34Q6D2_9BILA
MSQTSFYSNATQNTAERFDLVTLPTFQCQDWSEDQVISWLKGVDDLVLPYIRAFRKAKINGRMLLLLDDSELSSLGITSSFIREKIIHAVQLLQYYCYNVQEENLQRLAMLITFDLTSLLQAISKASPVIEQFNNGSDQLAGQKLTAVLNSVLMSFSAVYEHVKRLVFWLDRAPFESQKEYIQIRDKITELILEMLDSVNPQNRRFMPVSEVLHDRGLKLHEICHSLAFSTDPAILYIPYFAIAFIRNTEFKPLHGINFQSVFNGINLITSIQPDSPAERCKKLDAGDEILEINGETVIGWNYDKVRAKLTNMGLDENFVEQKPSDLKLLISKRPRDDGTSNTLPKSKTTEALIVEDDYENRNKLELDFSLKIQPDMFAREGSKRSLYRRRSSSFSFVGDNNKNNPDRLSMPVFNSSTIIASRSVGTDKKLYRRASVWSDSPPASFAAANRKIQNGLESKALMHLLDCWTEPRARPTGHLRLVRASRVAKATANVMDANSPVAEEDEDTSLEDEIKADKVDYTKIDVVLPTEAEKLKLPLPSINDPEWNAPVQEITGLRIIKRLHLESTSSVGPDSPLSAAITKISRFWNGETGSTSAMSTSCTSERGDISSIPSTPITKNALERIAKEKSRQITISPVVNNGFSMSKQNSSSHDSISSISSPRYCTIKTKKMLAPLAEPENDDEETLSKNINANLPVTGNSNEMKMEDYLKSSCSSFKIKIVEGWIRRQRIPSDPSYQKQKKASQWIKSWVIIVDHHILLSYSNQFAKSADLAIDLSSCRLILNPVEIKTSKKFVFSLFNNSTRYYFAPYSQQEYQSWTSKIFPLIQFSSSSLNNNSALETMTQSLQNKSDSSTDSAISSSPVANTIPRTFRTRGLFSKVYRQGSLSQSFGSNSHSEFFLETSVDEMTPLKTVR